MDFMRWRRYSFALSWAFANLRLVASVCGQIRGRPMKPAGKALTWALVVPKTVRGRGINRSAVHFTTKRRAL